VTGLGDQAPSHGVNQPEDHGELSPGSLKGVVIKRAVEDLPDINTLYEPKELAQIMKVVDSYVGLVLPPGANAASTPDMALTATLTQLTNAGSPRGLAAASPIPPETGGGALLKDKEGPLVLRPIFCRFLLASKMCGRHDSTHRYHECVAAFDEHAMRFEAFAGMPRNLLLRVLSGIVLPPQGEQMLMASNFSEEGRRLPPEVRFFLDVSLRAATDHYEVRRAAVEERIDALSYIVYDKDKQESEAEAKEGLQTPAPAATDGKGKEVAKTDPKAEVGSKVWPPLPPRYVAERDLPKWMTGIRQWEEELHEQSSSQLRALYAHTHTVVRGELLSSQLLEPEVLHFATRFKPLFLNLFSEYADEYSVDNRSQEVGGDLEDVPEEPGSPLAPGPGRGWDHSPYEVSATHYNHEAPLCVLRNCAWEPDTMSFSAFFRFCADFELFPRHASFDEIRQIFDDAECTHDMIVSEEEIPRTKVSPHASASAAAAVPKVDFTIFNKPLSAMNDLELDSIFFFSSIEEWLNGRFLRLADIIMIRMPEVLEELEEPRKEEGGGKRRRRKSVQEEKDHKDQEKAPALRPGSSAGPRPGSSQKDAMRKADKTVIEPDLPERITAQALRRGGSSATAVPSGGILRPGSSAGGATKEQPDHPQKEEHKKAERTKDRSGGKQGKDDAKDKERRPSVIDDKDRKGKPVVEQKPPIVQVPPSFSLSPAELLQLAAPPGPSRLIEEAKLAEIFRLFLGMTTSSTEEPKISVYQLDKIMSKAKAACERSRISCCTLLGLEQELSGPEKRAIHFLEALDQHLLDRSHWDDGRTEDILADRQEITAANLMEIASNLGLNSDSVPSKEELGNMMAKLGGKPGDGAMSRHQAYRMLALTQERRRCQRESQLKARLQFVAQRGMVPSVQEMGAQAHADDTEKLPPRGCGLPAFVECLLKLVLHRLGSKGLSEIQRGAPAWWKCTWLLTLLSGRFNERMRLRRHEDRLQELSAGEATVSTGPSKDLDLWWQRVKCKNLPKYVPPLERLMADNPRLFDPEFAEAQVKQINRVPASWDHPCPQCQEKVSPSGWGSPGCVLCGGIENCCLPVDDHIFSALLRTQDSSDQMADSVGEMSDGEMSI